jgi:hypothetical protein
MDARVTGLIGNWRKRNIEGLYCVDKEAALDKMLELIPQGASVGFSGSQTLEQTGIIRRLEARSTKVFNPYQSWMTRQDSLDMRRQASSADYYLAGANAISEKGELVFYSAFGNRTSGIAYAKNVIIVAGINKVVSGLDEALARGREYATPLNCKRLNWQTPCYEDGLCRQDVCLYPEYKRMCCQILIIEAEAAPDRLKVVLVGESLGF